MIFPVSLGSCAPGACTPTVGDGRVDTLSRGGVACVCCARVPVVTSHGVVYAHSSIFNGAKIQGASISVIAVLVGVRAHTAATPPYFARIVTGASHAYVRAFSGAWIARIYGTRVRVVAVLGCENTASGGWIAHTGRTLVRRRARHWRKHALSAVGVARVGCAWVSVAAALVLMRANASLRIT